MTDPHPMDGATFLSFPWMSDTDAFDNQSRDTMLRWKFRAKQAGFFFRADSETGDWVLRSPNGSQWAEIMRLGHGEDTLFRVFRRRGIWYLRDQLTGEERRFHEISAALLEVHRTNP